MSTNDESNQKSALSSPPPCSPPRRFIFTENDMQHFKSSPAKRGLLSFVTALGRSAISASYVYDPSQPLLGLSPGMASLYGSLNAIASHWLTELPPDPALRARFGNPVFKQWHERLTSRTFGIIQCIMDCHLEHVVKKSGDSSASGYSASSNEVWDLEILQECSKAGQEAALRESEENQDTSSMDDKQKQVIIELQSFLHPCFGHHIRLDYGTGHECSFFIFLDSLCKLGIFGNIPKSSPPSVTLMAPIALSITSVYLQICRGIQTDYMLEPAGSHGVWGLDDYHCIPFYIGACQLQNKAIAQNYKYAPSSIHDNRLLASREGSSILYFQCIQYIKSLKKGVPFFESSPMLDDISGLPNWGKVSGGLLRLYEGEVLDKLPVVQHFVFGEIFKGKNHDIAIC